MPRYMLDTNICIYLLKYQPVPTVTYAPPHARKNQTTSTS